MNIIAWDRKMGFTYTNVTCVKHIIMFVKITVLNEEMRTSNSFRDVWNFWIFFKKF